MKLRHAFPCLFRLHGRNRNIRHPETLQRKRCFYGGKKPPSRIGIAYHKASICPDAHRAQIGAKLTHDTTANTHRICRAIGKLDDYAASGHALSSLLAQRTHASRPYC